jgi:hypothetical protein
MFADPVHFQAIRISIPQKSIYARLGFRKGSTVVKPREQERVEQFIQEAADIISLRGSARTVTIEKMDETGVVLDDGCILPSRSLARMLNGCSHAFMMGATAGQDIMDAIGRASTSDLLRAVVLDATASEMTDAALDWIVSFANQEFRRRSWKLTKKRFSAGYGDFSLENQRTIFNLIRMDVIGVSITESCILLPEKSVTAIAGIGTS